MSSSAPGVGNKTVELLFTVAGGASLNGASGAGIASDIRKIVSEMQSQAVTALTFTVSEASLKNIRNQIKTAVSNIQVTFDGSGIGTKEDTSDPTKSSGGRKTSVEKKNLKEVLSLYKEYYGYLKSASNTNLGSAQLKEYSRLASETYSKIEQKLKEYNIEASKTPEILKAQEEGYRRVMNAYNLNTAKIKDQNSTTSQFLTSSTQLDQLATKLTNLQTTLGKSSLFGSLEPAKLQQLQTELGNLQTRLSGMADESGRFSSTFATVRTADFERLATDANALEAAIKNVMTDAQAGYAELIKYENSFAKLANRAQDYLTKVGPSLSRNPQMYQDLVSLIDKLRTGDGFKSVTQASAAFQGLQYQIKQAGLETQTLYQQIKQIFSEKLGYGVIATAALYARSTLRELINTVVELDTKMTELQIVSGESGSTMATYFDDAAESAKRVAASITDIIDATTVFRRLGFELQDSLKFAEYTTMYSKVGGVEISDAEANITAMIKAFDLSADDLSLALDKMVTTGEVYCPTA